MEASFMDDEVDKERMQRAEDKINEALAKEIQKNDASSEKEQGETATPQSTPRPDGDASTSAETQACQCAADAATAR